MAQHMRDRLGRFGVWRTAGQVTPDLAAALEELGFGTLWLGSSPLRAPIRVTATGSWPRRWRSDAGHGPAAANVRQHEEVTEASDGARGTLLGALASQPAASAGRPPAPASQPAAPASQRRRPASQRRRPASQRRRPASQQRRAVDHQRRPVGRHRRAVGSARSRSWSPAAVS
jgi:hypothetical protein